MRVVPARLHLPPFRIEHISQVEAEMRQEYFTTTVNFFDGTSALTDRAPAPCLDIDSPGPET